MLGVTSAATVFMSRTYEGRVPGPTLRLKPGEVLKLRLANDFPPNRDDLPANMSVPHLLNATNFHFHGSHASPSGIATTT